MSHDPRHGERGFALITALLSTLVLLVLGLALLAVVDVQTTESANERTRDRGFNLSEGLLTTQAFVLGRAWPDAPDEGVTSCSAESAVTKDTVGAAGPVPTAVERVRTNIDATYADDPAYAGATWRITVCDDDPSSTVWSEALLAQPSYDANANSKLWVRAESTVAGKRRVVVGLVRVRETPAFNSRYALAAGGLTDDLGASINTLSSGVLGGVLGDLLSTEPTVAEQPPAPPPAPALPVNGKTGVRCGATDIAVLGGLSTCVTGTLAAAGALPVVQTLVTDGRVEHLSGDTATTPENIGRLRAQAQRSSTYTDVSPGAATPTAAPACKVTGMSGANSVVFIERVGAGPSTPGVPGGAGDQYCQLSVGTAVTYKAIVVASGRVVIRGNGAVTADANQAVNTFKGVVYGLNQQRLPVADGGQNLGDAAAPGREIVRIDGGAHVRGGVNADGKSGRVGVYPPPITYSQRDLQSFVCARRPVRCLLGAVFGTLDAVLGVFGLNDTVDGLLAQLGPQRGSYGSAITADVDAINAVTVYGASGVLPGTFKDLAGR